MKYKIRYREGAAGSGVVDKMIDANEWRSREGMIEFYVVLSGNTVRTVFAVKPENLVSIETETPA
jgi:hypothetical protein